MVELHDGIYCDALLGAGEEMKILFSRFNEFQSGTYIKNCSRNEKYLQQEDRERKLI